MQEQIVEVDALPRCEWFALCTNDAEQAMWHPVLGYVPICSRCMATVDAINGETR